MMLIWRRKETGVNVALLLLKEKKTHWKLRDTQEIGERLRNRFYNNENGPIMNKHALWKENPKIKIIFEHLVWDRCYAEHITCSSLLDSLKIPMR